MAIGTKKIEDFVPIVKYNEGIYTELDITTTGNLNVTGDIVVDDVSIDALTVTGNTVLGNAVSDTLTINAAATVAATAGLSSSVATVKAPFAPIAVQQAITTNTAVSLTTFNSTIDSTSGALASITLADSTVVGQHKRIQMIVDNGDATVTFNTNATIVFADVGDVAELMWNGSDWLPIALYNCADGATAPAYTPAS